MFAIVAAFGVVMATVTAVLPRLQQAHAIRGPGKLCKPEGTGTGQRPLAPPCSHGLSE
jgi:hypothetical protein